jgi:hypothetical protein
MSADFRGATSKNVHKFLAQAAHDDNFRNELKTRSETELAELLSEFGVDVAPEDIPPCERRNLPTRDQCQQLIAMFGVNDEFATAAYEYGSTSLAPLVLVVAYAMPLMATAESEVAAAG